MWSRDLNPGNLALEFALICSAVFCLLSYRKNVIGEIGIILKPVEK